MANATNGCDGTALSENIAFIKEWTETPEPPGENEVPRAFMDASNAAQYALTFDDENEIAQAFAVMLFMPDDQNKIAAVCVEEKHGGSGLIVRVAMNTGKLNPLADGLRDVASHLQMVAKSDKCTTESQKQLINDIIKCNLKRILSCLRSKHSKDTPGESLARRLLEVFATISAESSVPELQKIEFAASVCKLIRAFKILEGLSEMELKARACLRIAEIMEEAKQLTKTHNLRALIKTIPPASFSKSLISTQNLVESFERLSQYLLMARHLTRMAHKYKRLFEDIEIQCEDRLWIRSQDRHSLEPGNNVTSRLQQWMNGPVDASEKLSRIEQELGKSPNDINALIRRLNQDRKKVHAEIQLLLYYEIRTDAHLRPRVLCSCKHACYLCDTFIKVHGKFYCPSTHGKLYPGWRIPTLSQLVLQETRKPNLLDLIERFNQVMESKIDSLVSKKKPRNESRDEFCVFRQGSGTSLRTIYANPTTGARDVVSTSFGSPRSNPLGAAPNLSSNSGSLQLTRSKPLHRRADSGVDLPDIGQVVPIQLEQARKRTTEIFTIMEHDPEAEMTFPPSLRQGIQPVAVHIVELTRGEVASQRLQPGSAVRFHSRKIHLEFEYGDMLRIASASNVDISELAADADHASSIIIDATWMGNDYADTLPSKIHGIDLSIPWIMMSTARGILFTGEGLVFRKRRDVVTVKARVGNI